MTAIRDEVTKGNNYMFKETLQKVRTLCRFRADLFEAKSNYKNKFKNEGLLCDSCESKVDQNTYVLFCSAYAKLRDGKSLNCDSDLAKYLAKVLDIRTNHRLNR